MEYLQLLTSIAGFVTLAFLSHRNTMAISSRIEQFGKEMKQDFASAAAQLEQHIDAETMNQRGDSLHEEMSRFRSEMNRRFDQANTQRNRRFDMLSHDIGDIRERLGRVEEKLTTSGTPTESAA